MNEVKELGSKYSAWGICVGNLWGGGQGSFLTRHYHNDDLETMKKEIQKDLRSGTIDSGMGFESMIRATMVIQKVTSIKYKEEIFKSFVEVEELFENN